MAARSSIREMFDGTCSILPKALAKHVKRVHTGGRRYKVQFTVGVQTFDVGRPDLTRGEAVWFQRQFLIALKNLCREHYHVTTVDILTDR